MKIGVVVFPGTNCDEETRYVLGERFGHRVEPVWHREEDLSAFDCVVLPGGFSYGDHLRAGAIARFSPVMRAVERFARWDRLVLGICNGFQILAEAGLLPGTLLPNAGGAFRCSWVHCRVESNTTPVTAFLPTGRVLRLPIAHGEGRYFVDPRTLDQIEHGGQVVLRYCDGDGRVSGAANPNGSAANIAGVCNEGGNVFGLMPHPERAAEPELPSGDGALLLTALDGWTGPSRPRVGAVAAPERASEIGKAATEAGAASAGSVPA